MELKGQTAVVTGASGGIGRAIALRLARSGASVVVCTHRRVAEANAIADEIRALAASAEVAIADLSDANATSALIDRIWQTQEIDIWINNAGADVLTGDVAEKSFSVKLDQLWKVDVLGTIRCSRDVGNRMKSVGRGTIVNVGWDQAWHGMEGDSGEMFATIKGAIMSFTMSLAKSLAPEVRVNCVAPGWIKTAWGKRASTYWQARARRESLVNRWGIPEDIAESVCFLVSPAASFINGQILPVNGGFRSSQCGQDP